MAKKAGGEKVVILHGVVNHPGATWQRGQVVEREALKYHAPGGEEGKLQEHDAYERLESLGAIRVASSEEADQEMVDVSGVPLALSPLAQAELAAKDARIETLTRQAGELQDKVRAAEALGIGRGKPPALTGEEKAALEAASAEKDAQIEALQGRIKALEEKSAAQAKAQAQQEGQVPTEQARGGGAAQHPPTQPPAARPAGPQAGRHS